MRARFEGTEWVRSLGRRFEGGRVGDGLIEGVCRDLWWMEGIPTEKANEGAIVV